MFALPLNDQGLPYPDPIHPILVHFVIAMVFFAFFCDVMGYFTRRHLWFEVGFWNLFVAAITIFLAVIVGQFEAGLATPYQTVAPVLNGHTILGWSLAVIVVATTAWRFVIRAREPRKIPPAYLGVATFLVCLVSLQVYLGSKLVWVYGLHVKPVVQALQQEGQALSSTISSAVSSAIHSTLLRPLGISIGTNGLPYEIPIHPQLVHFTLGLIIIAIMFDIIGTLFPLEKPIFGFLGLATLRKGLFQVGWYNLLAGAIITFFTVAAGFFELMLATPSDNKTSWGLGANLTLLLHGLGGLLLLAAIVAMTIWRGWQRYRWRRDAAPGNSRSRAGRCAV